MARRQDRRVIKIEAAYGSDRQTFIVKRNYELRVRDVQEDASKTFRMPVDQIVLYWKVSRLDFNEQSKTQHLCLLCSSGSKYLRHAQ